MPTLEYTGRYEIRTTDGTVDESEVTKLHDLLDEAIAAYEGTDITLETAVIHFERQRDREGQDMPRLHIDASREGPLSELATAEEALARAVVEIGMEPDLETAKDAIEIA
jgi:hypothetical protein